MPTSSTTNRDQQNVDYRPGLNLQLRSTPSELDQFWLSYGVRSASLGLRDREIGPARAARPAGED